jgi:hypothetical protein
MTAEWSDLAANVACMRWDSLFADLEARFEAEERAAAEADLVDLVRAERTRLTLRDRLRAHVGAHLVWTLGAGEASVRGELLDVGTDWALVCAGRDELVVNLSALQYVSGLSRAASPEEGEVARRWGLGVVLRGLARDRAPVSVRLRGGDLLIGTIDRVGADHVDIAVHPGDLPRRSEAVLGLRTVLVAAIVSVAVR